jgi:hypothetical protein
MRDKVGAEHLQQVHHCTTQTGGSDCGPDGQRSAPSGSRRAATSVRNNRRVCSETVEDHDRRFWHRWPLTWRSSHAFTVLNTTQFHVRRLGTDLARRKPGVQIPSPPPPTSQVRASPSPHRRRSHRSWGRLGPHWATAGLPVQPNHGALVSRTGGAVGRGRGAGAKPAVGDGHDDQGPELVVRRWGVLTVATAWR